MAVSRTYIVTVFPVFLTASGGYLSDLPGLGPQAKWAVDAAGFEALDAAVDAHLPTVNADLPTQDNFTGEDGEQGFLVYAHMAHGQRKPAGFDARYRNGRQVRRAAIAQAVAA